MNKSYFEEYIDRIIIKSKQEIMKLTTKEIIIDVELSLEEIELLLKQEESKNKIRKEAILIHDEQLMNLHADLNESSVIIGELNKAKKELQPDYPFDKIYHFKGDHDGHRYIFQSLFRSAELDFELKLYNITKQRYEKLSMGIITKHAIDMLTHAELKYLKLAACFCAID